MASLITRSNHPDALWPGVLEWFGLSYDEYDKVWDKIFDKVEGSLATEKLVEATGFGMARVKTEAAPLTYDTDGEGYRTNATPVVFGLGYQVTREELEDNLYDAVSRKRAASLAFSMRQTIENVHADTLIKGFNTQFAYGDGQPLFSAAHPTKSGPQSNLLSIAADFSEASLEDILKQIFLAKNNRGLQINLQPEMLIVSSADIFNAERVLQSQLRTGNTPTNDINAIKNMGLIPQGALADPYLGDVSGAWYLKTKMPKGQGLVSIWRREVELEKDNDFDTENAKAKATCRFTPSVADWRAIFASAGA